MPSFDIDAFFQSRFGNVSEGAESVNSKAQSLDTAITEKRTALAEEIEKSKRYKEARKKTWVGEAWLDAPATSTEAQIVNKMAGFASTTSDILGNIHASGHDRRSEDIEGVITEEMRNALNRESEDQATPEDLELLNSKPLAITENLGDLFSPEAIRATLFQQERREKTARELMTESLDSMKQAQKLRKAFDISEIVDNSSKGELTDYLEDKGMKGFTDQLVDGAEKLKDFDIAGLKELIKGGAGLAQIMLHAGVDNPDAMLQVLAESAPEMLPYFFGGLGGQAVGLGVGAMREQANYADGLLKHTKETGQPYLSEDEREYRQQMGAVAAAADGAGDLLLTGPLKGAVSSLKKLGTKTVKEVGEAASKEVAETAAKTLRESLLNVAGGTAKVGARLTGSLAAGAVPEAGTEALQTWASGEAGGDPATRYEVAEGAIIGGNIGGGLRGAGQSLKEAVGLVTSNRSEKEPQEEPAVTANFDKAVEANDPSAFLTKQNFRPLQALGVLQRAASKEGATEELVQGNLAQAQKIVNDLQTEKVKLQALVEGNDPKVLDGYKKDLQSAQAELASLDPADTETRAQLEDDIDFYQESIKEAEATSPERLAKHKANLARVETQAEQASQLFRIFQDEVTAMTVTPEKVQADFDEIGQVTATSAPEAIAAAQAKAENLVVLAMRSSGSVTPEQAQGLADNQIVSLPEGQRTYLRSFAEFKRAEIAARELGDVTGVVLYGNKKTKDMGIADYRAEISSAVNSGNKRVAEYYLKQMASFAKRHQAKADMIAKAYEASSRQGFAPLQIIGNKAGEWGYVAEPMSKDELRQKYGIQIDEKSPKIMRQVRIESDAINAALSEMRAAHTMKFDAGNVTPETSTEAQAITTSTEKPEASSVNSQSTQQTSVNSEELSQSQSSTVNFNPPSPLGETDSSTGSSDTTNLPRVQVGEAGSRLNDGAQQQRDLADSLGLTTEIEAEFAQGKTVAEVLSSLKKRLPEKFKNIDPADETPFIVQTRATLGIPSRGDADGVREFEAWKKARDARNATSPVPTPTPQAPTTSSPRTRVSAEQAKKISDEDLNDQVGALQDKRAAGTETAKDKATFSVLDAEMSSREDAASAAIQAEEGADLPPPWDEYWDTHTLNDAGQPVPKTEGTPEQTSQTQASDATWERVAISMLKSRYPDRAFDVLTAEQSQAVQAALETLRAYFGDALIDSVRFIQQSGQSAPGTSYHKEAVIGLHPEVFTTPVEGLDSDAIARVIRTVAHELGHVKDRADGVVSSEGTLEYASELGKAFKPGGVVFKEIQAAVAANPLLQTWFGYALDLPANRQARELYAQVTALYFSHPEVFNEHFPKAARAFPTRDGADQRAVDGPQQVSNGRGSRGVGQTGREDSDTGAAEGRTGQRQSVPVEEEPPAWDDIPAEAYDDAPQDTDADYEGDYDLVDAVEENQIVVFEPGTLNVLKGEVDPSQPYDKQNPVATHLVQDAGRDSDASLRPLAVVKDFLTHLNNKTLDLKGFVKESLHHLLGGKKDPYPAAIRKLQEISAKWFPTIDGNLQREANAEYQYQNLLHHFIEDEGGQLQLEENIKTALTVVGMSWLSEQPLRQEVTSDEEINRLLGRDENTRVEPHEAQLFADLGIPSNSLGNRLGQQVTTILGLKAKADAPLNVMSQVQSALGQMVIKVMADEGLVKRASIEASQMGEAKGKEASNAKAKLYFVTLNRNKAGRANRVVQGIHESLKGSQNILSSLFKTEMGVREPLFAPADFTQTMAKNAKQGVPELLVSVLKEKQEQEHFIREDMWNLIQGMGREATLRMAGWVEINEAKIHTRRLKGVLAKNAALERDYDNYLTFITKGYTEAGRDFKAPFFYEFEVWKNQRVGIATRLFNQQASKLHRPLAYQASWETEVRFDDDVAMENFLLRAGEGLGLKADRNVRDVLIEEMMGILGNPDIASAVVALRKQVRGEALTEQDMQDIEQGVKVGKKNLRSLDSLLALAYMREAQESGADSFTVQMMGEVDGVSNGPIMTMLSYAGMATMEALKAVANRGGIYFTGQDFTQYNQYKGAGNHDIYEDTMVSFNERIQERIDVNRRSVEPVDLAPIYSAIEAITGKWVADSGDVSGDGRDIVKAFFTPITFGAGLDKSTLNLNDAFIDAFYEKLETLANDGNVEALTEFAQQVNVLLEASGSKIRIPAKLSAERAMKLGSKELDNALASVFGEHVGPIVTDTINDKFGAFLEHRTVFTQASQLVFDLYNAAYVSLRQEMLKDLVKEGKIRQRKGQPIHDLSAKQEKELRQKLRRIAPVLHTAMSKEEGKLRNGIRLAKDIQDESRASMYANKSGFATPYADGTKSHRSQGNRRIEVRAGVAPVPGSIHSEDSAIAHKTQQGREILNGHDAGYTGLDGMAEMAQAFNQNFFEVMENYSPFSELYSSLARVVRGLDAMAKEGELPASFLKQLSYVAEQLGKNEEVHPETAFADYLRKLKAYALHADAMRLELLGDVTFVDQYAFDGGSFEVPTEARDRIAQKLANLKSVPTEAEMQAATSLSRYAAKGLKAATPQARREAAQVYEQAGTQAQESVLDNPEILRQPKAYLFGLLSRVWQDPSTPQAMKDRIAAFKAALQQAGILNEARIERVLETFQATRAEKAELINYLTWAKEGLPRAGWGTVGTPSIAPDMGLQQFLETRPNAPAKDLVRKISSDLQHHQVADKKAQQSRDALLALTKQIYGLIPEGTRIRYLTPESPLSHALGGVAVSNARGWYATTGSKDAIHILSPDFVESGLTPELVLHEVIHSILQNAIEELRTNPNADKDAKALVAELETLQAKALAQLDKTLGQLDKTSEDPEVQAAIRELSAIKEALDAPDGLHELVSWGMTNQRFQTEVLGKITLESKNADNAWYTRSGFKAFVDSLVQLLLKGTRRKVDERINTGLGTLLINTSGLFAYAAEVRNKAQPQTEADVRTYAQASAAKGRNAETYSTTELYDALSDGSLDAKTDAHLRGVLDNLVAALHGPSGVDRAYVKQFQSSNPQDTFWKAVKTGQMPFASAIFAQPFEMSAQEAFVSEQVEAVVRAAIADSTTTTKEAYKQLSDLYREAYRVVKPEDLDAGDLETAKALHAFMFDIQGQQGDARLDHLSRFAALALTNAQVRRALERAYTRTTPERAEGFLNRVKEFFHKALRALSTKATKVVPGSPMNAQLATLLDTLVGIENRRAARLNQKASWDVLGSADTALKGAAQKGLEAAKKVSQTPLVRKGVGRVVGVAIDVTDTAAEGRFGQLVQNFQHLRDRAIDEKHGMIANLFTEMVGHRELFQRAIRLVKRDEGTRKDIKTGVAKVMLKSFAKGGALLQDAHKKALTAALLRTGAYHLFGAYTIDQIAAFYADRQNAKDAVTQLEDELTALHPKFADEFIYHARNTAWLHATGEAKGIITYQNSDNMANLRATDREGTLTPEEVDAVKPILDKMIALYGITYQSDSSLRNLQEVFAQEAARKDGGNGIEMALRTHRFIVEDAKARVFKNLDSQMIHGYVPEVYDPHVSILVANAADGRDLELAGWSKGGALAQDPLDPTAEPMFVYTLRDGGLREHPTGVVSLTAKHMRGTSVTENVAPWSETGMGNDQVINKMTHDKKKALAKIRMGMRNYDPSKQTGTHLVPTFNENGGVSDYRYLMKESTKDTILRRDNRFEHLLGTLHSQTFDKEISPENNRMAIEAVHEVYKREYARKPQSFSEVSATSKDPELRQLYALLPEETKQAIREITGRDALLVPNDSVWILFGYRKLSLATPFEKQAEERTMMEKMYVDMFEYPVKQYARTRLGLNEADAAQYAKRISTWLRRGETGWRDIVREVKDIIVVKTGVVTAMNHLSNVGLLKMYGVPMRDIVKYHKEALDGLYAWQTQTARRDEIQMLLSTGFTQGEEAALKRELALLENDIERNPIRPLIEDGLLPSIVEDVVLDKDLYSYKTLLQDKVEGYVSKLPEVVREAGKHTYLTRDTEMYQFLAQAAKSSDFIGRYALYQHLTTRKTNRLSEAAARQKASDAFINYDIPLDPTVQYLDDMGIIPFTKYFLRIQRVIADVFKDSPASTLFTILADDLLGMSSTIMESSLIHRFGNNPLQGGAFKAFTVWDELPAFSATGAIIK